MVAHKEGCSHIFHVGDLIHEKHVVLVEMLIAIYEEFVYALNHKITWVLIPGNHDMPSKDKPTNTLLHLFSRVAHVYIQPRVLKGNGWSIYLNPWRMSEAFKENTKKLGTAAKADSNPFRLQLAHIGLREGQLSPSNTYRVPSSTSLTDMFLNNYTMTLCGDYHMTQQLHDRLWYLGAPIPHIHGDRPSQGVWIVDTAGKGLFEQIPLPGPWPEYHTLNLDTKKPLELQAANFYKLRIPAALRPHYETLYGNNGNVKIEVVGDPLQINPTARRLEGIAEGDTRKVLDLWLRQKGYLDPEYQRLGDEYLRRAEQWLYENRA